MDATRARRQKDSFRQRWYARFRQWRLARHMGFTPEGALGLAARVICPERAGWDDRPSLPISLLPAFVLS